MRDSLTGGAPAGSGASITVSPSALRSAAAHTALAAADTTELRGEFDSCTPGDAACGDASVAGAWSDFHASIAKELAILAGNGAQLGTDLARAATLYEDGDASTMALLSGAPPFGADLPGGVDLTRPE